MYMYNAHGILLLFLYNAEDGVSRYFMMFGWGL